MQTVTKFGYKTSYTVIPTKAVSLNQDDYELSQTAVNALREIEKCLVYDRSVVNDRCAIFFDKFGSHYYTGTYHFGGIYQKIATVEIDKEISTSEATNMCEKALRARFKATYNAGIANASGGFSASRSSGATSGEENTTSTEDSKVNVSQRKIGGPQETDDILAWKEGLVSTRDTWQIIDREDMSYSKFDGIWKLILCCTSSFQDPISLVLAVLEAWESVSGITNKTDNYVYIDLLDKLIGKLTYQCVGDKLNPDSLKGLLQALDKVTEKLKENVVADDIWDKKCSLHVREFLKNVETCCSSRESCILAGRLLKKFKKPATSISVKTILGELRNAHKRFYSVDICDVDGLNALQNETTNSLQKSFLRLRDTDLLQFIFFASSLYALGKEMLDVSEMRFQHNMSQHNLKNMIENADNCCEDFKAFDRITRGDVDTEEIIQCLKRLISSLKRIANDENLSQQCLDYLGKDTRTQAFVEVVSRHLSTTTDTRKSSILDLLMELIDTERGIGLQKWRTIIALLEMAASDDQKKVLSSDAVGRRGRKLPVRLTEINGFWSGSQEDDFNPSIAGLDVTDDGCILLADGMNRNIKLFTANGQLLSVFALNNLPLDVTLINKTEAVVAARPMIPIISIDANNHIVLKRSITPKLDTTNIIDEIASYKDYLIFITMHSKGCHGSLAMMDMDGNMIWTRAKEIQVDDNSHLAIQHDNGGDDRVIFTSEFKGRIYIYIVAADTGEVLKAFKDEDTNLSGVAVDSLGRVYISNGCSIRVFSKSLDEERFITKCEDYGLICCNRKRGELIVMTGEMLDSIAIFRIELKSAEENNKVLI